MSWIHGVGDGQSLAPLWSMKSLLTVGYSFLIHMPQPFTSLGQYLWFCKKWILPGRYPGKLAVPWVLCNFSKIESLIKDKAWHTRQLCHKPWCVPPLMPLVHVGSPYCYVMSQSCFIRFASCIGPGTGNRATAAGTGAGTCTGTSTVLMCLHAHTDLVQWRDTGGASLTYWCYVCSQ